MFTGIPSKYKELLDEDDIQVIPTIGKLFKQCRTENNYPTQIVLGKKAFEIALKDLDFQRYFVQSEDPSIRKTGLVGYLSDVPVYTNFYESNTGWFMEDEAVLLNVGNRLMGNL